MLIPGLSRKKLFTALVIAFLILLAGGCLKYCAQASRSTEKTSPETAKGDKQDASSKLTKAPTPLSDNLLEKFPEDVKKNFQYVVLIAKSAWGDFLNDKPLDTSKSTPLSGKKTPLPAKRLTISEIKENEIIVTPDLVSRIFDNLGKNWYLDWDRLRNTFRPLTIRLEEGLSQSSLRGVFSQVLKESRAKSSNDIHAKLSLNPEKLYENMEAFLKSIQEVEKENIELRSADNAQTATTDSEKPSKGWLEKLVEKWTSSAGTEENKGQSAADTDPKQTPNSDKSSKEERPSSEKNTTVWISPDLKQRLAFISRSSIDGCYIIFYLKDNNYELLLQKKIGWSHDGQAIVINQKDFIGVLSPLFLLDAPTLVLKDEKLTELVDRAMVHRKGTNGKLDDKERKALQKVLTNKVMETLKEKPGVL
jgi:hypothetical protein